MADLVVPASQITVHPHSDAIASRIDTYQSDLSRLEADFTAARAALHTEFRADIATLVHNGNWQVYPERDAGDARRVAEHREAIRALKAEPVSLDTLAQHERQFHDPLQGRRNHAR